MISNRRCFASLIMSIFACSFSYGMEIIRKDVFLVESYNTDNSPTVENNVLVDTTQFFSHFAICEPLYSKPIDMSPRTLEDNLAQISAPHGEKRKLSGTNYPDSKKAKRNGALCPWSSDDNPCRHRKDGKTFPHDHNLTTRAATHFFGIHSNGWHKNEAENIKKCPGCKKAFYARAIRRRRDAHLARARHLLVCTKIKDRSSIHPNFAPLEKAFYQGYKTIRTELGLSNEEEEKVSH